MADRCRWYANSGSIETIRRKLRCSMGGAKEQIVRNPWAKKNPFMSLWLSGANKVGGAARSQAMAAGRKQQQDMAREATKLWLAPWLGWSKPTPKSKK